MLKFFTVVLGVDCEALFLGDRVVSLCLRQEEAFKRDGSFPFLPSLYQRGPDTVVARIGMYFERQIAIRVRQPGRIDQSLLQRG